MNKITFPDPAEYLDSLVKDIHHNMASDYKLVSRQLAEKVMGFKIKTFGELEISNQKFEYIFSKLDPELLKKTDDIIIKQIEENLQKTIPKTFITRLTDDIRFKIYTRLEEELYNIISEYIVKKIEEQLIPELDTYFTTWKVAAKLVDANEKK
jgi:hypothetical protein